MARQRILQPLIPLLPLPLVAFQALSKEAPSNEPEDQKNKEARLTTVPLSQRDLHPSATATREELVERVKANLRAPRA